MRFLIEGPRGPGGEPGPQFELTDVDYFLREHAPKGFTIVANPPAGYDVPTVDVPKPQEMSRADLNAFATQAGVVDPESFPNKTALLEAIDQAQQPSAEPIVPTETEPVEPEGTEQGTS